MGGFFGIVSKAPCVNLLFYGVDYHSHLGTKRAGMVSYNPDGRFARSIHRIENSYFRNKFEDELSKFQGKSGIGVISDTEPQPIVMHSHLGPFAIATVARINNLQEIANQLLRKGVNFSELSSGDLNATEIVGHLITQSASFQEGIDNALNLIEGSCSLLLLTPEGLIAARDKKGRTPVVMGKGPGMVAFASESCSFPNMDLQTHQYLGPGEVLFVNNKLEVTSWRTPEKQLRICSFLYIYYGFPTSCYEGINVDEVRFRNGMALGKADDASVDAVCSIPDSGTGMAMGYAVGKGVPYRMAVSKYTPTWPRSFMPGDPERRKLVARMKLLPNPQVLKGARLACCDDSIVRGTQLKNNVNMLYAYGAKEIHVRISCPPLIFGCPFLNFSASRSDMELITRRFIATQKCRELARYADPSTEEYAAMVEHLRKEMNFTSLKFSTLEHLIASLGLPRCAVCTHCFDGSEP